MHLHHELRRALADTKIDGTTTIRRRPAAPEMRARPEQTNRGIRVLFGHRRARRGGRSTGTLGAGQH